MKDTLVFKYTDSIGVRREQELDQRDQTGKIKEQNLTQDS